MIIKYWKIYDICRFLAVTVIIPGKSILSQKNTPTAYTYLYL